MNYLLEEAIRKDQYVNLTEIFDLSPFGLKNEISTFNGIKIYSNNKIKKYFIDQLDSNKDFRVISNSVKRGLDSKKITIGYLSKSKWRFFIKSALKYLINMSPNILGVYDLQTKKILIVLDDNVRALSGKEIVDIVGILYHELCHLTANFFQKEYFNTFNNIINHFFKDTINYISKGAFKYDAKVLNNHLQYVFNQAEGEQSIFSGSWISSVSTKWDDFFLKYDEKNGKIYAFFIYAPFINYSIKQYPLEYQSSINIGIKGYEYAYKQLGMKDPLRHTLPCQEAFFLSEILSVYLTYSKNTHLILPMINKIKWDY